jgi:AcrR family transcriptional regulator
MNSQDRRALRTNRLLADALVDLSTQKSYDAITIRDIVDRANIAYSTFFHHYQDKDALLRDMATEAIATFNCLVEGIPNCTSLDIGRQIFHHATTHEALYRIFLNGQGVNRVFQEVQEDLRRLMLKHFAAEYQKPKIPPDVVVNHFLSSLFSIIKWWLDHDKPYAIDQMAYIYDRLIVRATFYAVTSPASDDLPTVSLWAPSGLIE